MTFFTNVKRVARYGLIGFIRNGFVSLAAILIITITLFVLASMIIVSAALHATLASLENKVDIAVYFTPSASDEAMSALEQSIEALPEVASVTYTSREQALALFQDRHKNDQLTKAALDELGENPFGASLEIRAKKTSQYESIAKFLEQQQSIGGIGEAIDKVNFYQNKTAIDRLSNIIGTSRKASVMVAFVLAICSVLIAFNTIRLAIYTSREEIGVMNLVGASNWYVRGPFMVAGVLYGVISAAVVLILLYPVTAWLGPPSERFLVDFNVFNYFVSSLPMLIFTIAGSGIALGALSSYLAVRRYLR